MITTKSEDGRLRYIVEVDRDAIEKIKTKHGIIYKPKNEGSMYRNFPQVGCVVATGDPSFADVGARVWFHHFTIHEPVSELGQDHYMLEPKNLLGVEEGETLKSYNRIICSPLREEEKKTEAGIIIDHNREIIPNKAVVEFDNGDFKKGDIITHKTGADYDIEVVFDSDTLKRETYLFVEKGFIFSKNGRGYGDFIEIKALDESEKFEKRESGIFMQGKDVFEDKNLGKVVSSSFDDVPDGCVVYFNKRGMNKVNNVYYIPYEHIWLVRDEQGDMQALSDKVLVKLIPPPKEDEGLIISKSKEPSKGLVVSSVNLETEDIVLYDEGAGTELEIKGEKYVLLLERNIYGTLIRK